MGAMAVVRFVGDGFWRGRAFAGSWVVAVALAAPVGHAQPVGKAPARAAPAPAGVGEGATPRPTDDDSRRWDACVQAHNALAGVSHGEVKGLAALLAKHQAHGLAARTGAEGPEPLVLLNTGALRVHVHALQRALATPTALPLEPPGGLQRMHSDASAFLRLMERWAQYVSSGHYRHDGYALGRQLEPQLVSGWQALIEHQTDLGDWLQAAERERRRATAAEARVVGDRVLADVLEALAHASELLDVWDDPPAAATARSLVDGDRVAQRLEAVVARLQRPGVVAPLPGREPARIGPVAQALVQLLSVYRSARRAGGGSQGPGEQALDAMEAHYNTAVRLADRLP
jgi:hypothetical protein